MAHPDNKETNRLVEGEIIPHYGDDKGEGQKGASESSQTDGEEQKIRFTGDAFSDPTEWDLAESPQTDGTDFDAVKDTLYGEEFEDTGSTATAGSATTVTGRQESKPEFQNLELHTPFEGKLLNTDFGEAEERVVARFSDVPEYVLSDQASDPAGKLRFAEIDPGQIIRAPVAEMHELEADEQESILEVPVDNGKYTFRFDAKSGMMLTPLRHGEVWPGGRDMMFNKSVSSMAIELHQAREERDLYKQALRSISEIAVCADITTNEESHMSLWYIFGIACKATGEQDVRGLFTQLETMGFKPPMLNKLVARDIQEIAKRAEGIGTEHLQPIAEAVSPLLGRLYYLALRGWWNDVLEWAEEQLHPTLCEQGMAVLDEAFAKRKNDNG